MEEDATERVSRVVRGGATMFPRETPRPPALPMSEVFQTWALESIRAPLIATVLCKLTLTSFQRFARKRYGADENAIFNDTITNLHAGIYFGMFAFFELFGKQPWLYKYQLPRTAAQEPTFKMKMRAIAEFIVNTLVTKYVILPWAHGFFTTRAGMPSVYSDLPSFFRVFLHFTFASNFNMLLFAIFHRLFHHGPLYRAFHKKHHEFVGTVTIAAENAHPLEHALANVLPTIGGCFLSGAHPYIWFVWLAWRFEQTLESHSGYCFHGSWLQKIGLTNSEAAAFHDFHHTENKGAFGSEWTDYMFGTMDKWIAIGRTEGYVKRAREQHERERKALE